MTGQQGAINKLESGDVSGALHDIATWFENRVVGLEKQFPALGTFVSQFATDFGKQVLADAEALAPAVLAGTTPITVAAGQLVSQAAAQAGSLAVKDATTIALNALRVQVTGLAIAQAAAPAPVPTPAPVPAVDPASPFTAPPVVEPAASNVAAVSITPTGG